MATGVINGQVEKTTKVIGFLTIGMVMANTNGMIQMFILVCFS